MNEKIKNTKQTLILSGLKLFGEYGLTATSTRMLAEDANVNLAAIKYHFKNKEGLYHAVIADITSRLSSGNSQFIKTVAVEIEDSKISVTRAKEIYKKLLLNIANLFITNDESKYWIKIIMREQASPTIAFEIIYNGHLKQILNMFLKLSSTIYGCDVDNKLIAIRQQIMLGQILGFVVARESFKRMSNQNDIKELKTKIIQQISICIDAIISTPLKAPLITNTN